MPLLNRRIIIFLDGTKQKITIKEKRVSSKEEKKMMIGLDDSIECQLKQAPPLAKKNNGVHGRMEGGDLLCTSLQVERSTRILQPHTYQDQTIMNTPQLHGTWNPPPPHKVPQNHKK